MRWHRDARSVVKPDVLGWCNISSGRHRSQIHTLYACVIILIYEDALSSDWRAPGISCVLWVKVPTEMGNMLHYGKDPLNEAYL